MSNDVFLRSNFSRVLSPRLPSQVLSGPHSQVSRGGSLTLSEVRGSSRHTVVRVS